MSDWLWFNSESEQFSVIDSSISHIHTRRRREGIYKYSHRIFKTLMILKN